MNMTGSGKMLIELAKISAKDLHLHLILTLF